LRAQAYTRRRPQWPGTGWTPPGNTGSPGPTARCWPTTWPRRWCRWADGTKPARSSSGRCSFPRPRSAGRASGGWPATSRWPAAATLTADGLAQQAHRVTFAAEAEEAGWDDAARAWEAVGQPYPLALALLRAAEATLNGGDRDGGASRLSRAAELAQRLGAR